MRFHVLMPGCALLPAITQPWEYSLKGGDIVRIARVLDELEYEGVLFAEHFVVGGSHGETTGRHFIDATTAQAIVAGATTRLRVNSMVTLLPLHHPVVLAKSLSTLDWMSDGRAAVTVGLGWQPEEYQAVGVPWSKRGRIADEYLEAMLELWSSENPSFGGEFVHFADVIFEPKPVQRPKLPVWVGGDSPAALRRAARFGDGWAPWLTQPVDIPAGIETITSNERFDVRPFAVFYSTMSLRIGMEDGHHAAKDTDSQDGSVDVHRSVDECGQLADLGVTDTWVPAPPVRDVEEYLDNLRWVAEEVVPRVNGS